VTIANFMMALAVISETDLIAALPRQLVAMHAARFGVVSTQAPLPLPLFQIRAVAPKVAMMDAGLAWLFEAMRDTVHINRSCTCRPRPDSCS
jgi:DNA-binding transcriptional LysR family regulator